MVFIWYLRAYTHLLSKTVIMEMYHIVAVVQEYLILLIQVILVEWLP